MTELSVLQVNQSKLKSFYDPMTRINLIYCHLNIFFKKISWIVLVKLYFYPSFKLFLDLSGRSVKLY